MWKPVLLGTTNLLGIIIDKVFELLRLDRPF